LNAKKYTPTGGSIHVKADILLGEDRLEYLRVSITDTGSGISEDELEHVFVPYYRGEGARKSKRSGTGLGLAIAKEIIDVHHGRIGVDSRKEEGSTFYFMLPVAIRGDAK